MARSAGEGSAMDRLAYRIGYASARMDRLARAARSFAEARFDVDDDDVVDEDEEEAPAARRSRGAKPRTASREGGSHGGGAELAAQAALGALASRFITPNPINWPRAVVAGTLGALVYEIIDRVELRLAERNFGTSTAIPTDRDDNVPSWVMRCATGVALASLYAKYAYGRLPGPPLMQGVAFGALEAATHTGGGAAALMAGLAPDKGVPFGEGSLAGETDSPYSSLVRHLAFGAVVGIVYRS